MAHEVGHSRDFCMIFGDLLDVIPWIFVSVDSMCSTTLGISSKGGAAV